MAGAGNINTAVASGLGNAANTTGQVANMGPAQFGQQTAAMMNPYQQTVINNSLGDMNRARQMAMNDVGAQATAAGAFGGSRHGLVEAETNRNFADRAANMVGNLNYQGYNNAQNMAMGLNNQRLGAANQLAGLAGQGFGMASQLRQEQAQQGLMQQAMQQRLIDAAKAQYAGYTGAPAQSLQYPLAALGAAPVPQSQTSGYKPGLFDYLTMGASVLGGFCWVAREVYGPGEEWLQFRLWVTTKAPKWFFSLYAKHGEAFAGVVRRNPWMKRLIRPFMDAKRRSMGFK